MLDRPEIMHTTQRWGSSRDFVQPPGRGPNGRRFCRWCHEEVPKGRRTFCGERCLDLYWIRCSGGEVRRLVFKRDGGICAGCGMDAEKLARIIQRADRHYRELNEIRWMHEPMLTVAMELGMYAHAGTCWQPDHILPVAEGGGMCGLSNYRTLCTVCHNQEGGKLQRRLWKGNRLARREGQLRQRLATKAGQLEQDQLSLVGT